MEKELQLFRNLKAADVVLAKKRKGLGRILNHYIVYVGNETFIGNLQEGVKVLSNTELSALLQDYEPIQVQPFTGNSYMRQQAVNRAYSKIGQKYSLFKFNCEHYANWVQKGKESSNQVSLALTVLIVGGLAYNFINSEHGKRK